MATRTAGQSKTAFVRDFIRKDPTANRKAVEEAWREAGHESPISSAIVSNLRRELGLTGNLRRKRRRRHKVKARGADTTPATGRKPLSGGRGKVLAEIEQDIDRLIIKLMAVGGFESIEHELRKVRRLLYHSSLA